MGFLDRLRGLFKQKSDKKALESDVTSIQSLQTALPSFKENELSMEMPRGKKAQSISVAISNATGGHLSQTNVESDRVSVERDSYHLGLAAGYTGRSIREIEAALNRIESQMATKDWVTIKLDEHMEQIQALITGKKVVKLRAPEERKQPLTSKMSELLMVLRQEKTMSYADLALRMDMSVSDLRSLLTHMVKRTNEVERFRVGRAGWAKFIEEVSD
jgi:ribosome-binding protein aMBF1 (putative translation factor)